MKEKAVWARVLMIAATLLMGCTLHAQCAGNACGSIQMSYDGCYHFTNIGSQKVSIGLKPYGGISPWISTILGPGQRWDPFLYGGACLKGFMDDFQASLAR
jgi:hypothetical protein